IVMTMLGNLVVIISIAHFKQLHSPTNFLILSMATTDFLLSCVVMPFSMIRSIESCWYFGDLFCKVHSCCDIMLCTTSIFHLCFISVDRYYAVCDPLHYVTKITISLVGVFLLISWSIPIFFAFGLVFSELNIIGAEDFVAATDCTGLCVLIFNKLWGVLASFIAFFLPGTIMVGIYIHIFTVARKHARQIGTGSMMKHIGSESKMKASTKTETILTVISEYLVNQSPPPHSLTWKRRKYGRGKFSEGDERKDVKLGAGISEQSVLWSRFRRNLPSAPWRAAGSLETLSAACIPTWTPSSASSPSSISVSFLLTATVLSVSPYSIPLSSRQAQQINNLSKSLAGAAKRERKAAKTLGIAVGVYLLCWLPFTVDTMIDSLLNFITPPLVFDTFIWLAYFNSACNPIIYVFSYRWFRKALKLLLSREI
ncbi:Trace amine-associated receptor 4, partial [Bos mutus]